MWHARVPGRRCCRNTHRKQPGQELPGDPGTAGDRGDNESADEPNEPLRGPFDGTQFRSSDARTLAVPSNHGKGSLDLRCDDGFEELSAEPSSWPRVRPGCSRGRPIAPPTRHPGLHELPHDAERGLLRGDLLVPRVAGLGPAAHLRQGRRHGPLHVTGTAAHQDERRKPGGCAILDPFPEFSDLEPAWDSES